MNEPSVAAELELFHTRPTVATRRLALGHLILPTEPAPGAGAVLLGAVVARFITGVAPELRFDIARLVDEIEAGERIVQPRLRHRYQVDRHGLAFSHHRLVGRDATFEFEFDSRGTDLVQVLGAIYALERLAVSTRRSAAVLMRRALRWTGPVNTQLIAYLVGSTAAPRYLLADPRGWALTLLGFDDNAQPTIREITKAYRQRMRAAHPDHGGETRQAARAIEDLSEARRILNHPSADTASAKH